MQTSDGGISKTPGKSLGISSMSQFLALLYKELLLRKFHCIATSFQVILPIIIAVIPCMVFNKLNKTTEFSRQKRSEGKWVDYKTFYPEDILGMYGASDPYAFAYAPTNDVIDKLIEDSVKEFFGRSYKHVTTPKFKSEEELRKFILEKQKTDKETVIGTFFKGFGDTLPKDLDYKVYFPDDFKTRKKYILNGPDTHSRYLSSQFLRWQAAVGNAFLKKRMSDHRSLIDFQIFMQQFPYPRHKQGFNPSSLVFEQDFELYLHLALVIFAAAIVKRIVEVKNDGSKELMESMGMRKSAHWTSMFLSNFIVALIIVWVIVTVYKASLNNTFFQVQSDFILLFIILLFIMAHLILFCMTFSIFFNSAVFAMIAVVIVYLVSHALLMWKMSFFNPYLEDYFSLSLFHRLCICIHPGGALLTFGLIMQLFESVNEGVLWQNLTEYPLVPDINLLMVLGMIVFSFFFYVFAIWYFDAIWPWQPGVRKPFYFLFTKSYWFGDATVLPHDIELQSENSANFEEEPGSVVSGVVIKDLCKEIHLGKSSKVILHDVSLKCYQGQITALLGHREAGKTSLINIITGNELPTRGSVSMNGLNILTSTTHKPLGICPQHSVLCDELSVEQHLKFYAAMKGTSFGQLSSGDEQVLNSLKLSAKKAEIVSNLSYAEKKKLSIAIAIVGVSKVLVFDEPTYGVDAESKRHIWDTLLAIKQGRMVIVTTESFQEADILGDRIAVMVDGEIKSCGTPSFIKRKLASGYHLHILKDAKFDLQGLKSLITKHVSTATCGNDSLKEVSFNLGSEKELGDLFEELDNRQADLGIISYGVSLSTIRDALLTISNVSLGKGAISPSGTTENASTENEDVSRDTFHPALHASLICQFGALLLKHLHYSQRRWKFHLIQIAVPFILMLVCFYCIKISMESPYEPLKLDISSVYGTTDGFYYTNPYRLNLGKLFKSVLESNGIVNVEKVPEPTHYVLNYGNRDLVKYIKRLVVGGTMDTFESGALNLTAWYNMASLHSMPMSLLLMQTTLMRYIVHTGSISLEVEPIVPLSDIRTYKLPIAVAWWTQVSVPLVFTFLSVTFLLVPVRETVRKAKLLQLMSGVPTAMYWIATFLWDYLIYLVICIFLILPPAFFYHSIFFGKHPEAIGTLLALFLLYGWASLPLGYIVSILLKRENRGLFVFIGFCLLFSVVSIVMLANTASYYKSSTGKTPDKILNAYWFFRLFPLYSISMGVQYNIQIAFHNTQCDMFTPDDFALCNSTSSESLLRCCKDICPEISRKNRFFGSCHEQWNHFSLKGNETYMSNGPEALFLGLEGIVFFAVLFLLETRTATKFANIIILHLQRIWNQITRQHQVLIVDNTINDPQVLQEEERVRNLTAMQGGAGGEALAVLGLAKGCVLPSSVNRLTFGAKGEECFGILGVCGAGKTSMFRMLAGEDIPTEGNAFIQSYSLMGDVRKFRSHIGYCPEVDYFMDDLTGGEILLLFGRLRGLRGYELQKEVNELIQSLGLAHCADESTQFYSVGDKRKLSVAVALVGSPPVILLDEPTAGVGLESRRQIWKALDRVRKRTGAAILLATQSLEESESLCNRLAVLVKGRFRCLGSPDQLKSRQGQGCALTIKISKEDQQNPERANALKIHIQNSLKNATLTGDYHGMLHYQVVDPSMTVGQLFKLMSDMKSQFEVEDFSIGALSLEQTFLSCSRA